MGVERNRVGRADIESLRLTIYDSFARTRIDDPAGLAEARHVALDEAGQIVMAHPFSAVPLGFAVMGRTTLWWGGCAWDSFSLPHLLPTRTRCWCPPAAPPAPAARA